MPNPFDDPQPSRRKSAAASRKQKHPREDPIFEARHIEWPLPSTLPASLPEDISGLKSNNDRSNLVSNSLGNAGYLGGFVGKFIGQSSNERQSLGSHPMQGKSRALKAPRPHCAASANGWMVALVESGSVSSSNHIRLFSRWNVRRNIHQCMIVPNTFLQGLSSSSSSANSPSPSSAKKGRIVHVFLDPTGSHALLSGTNGDLFYCHCSSKNVKKLKGFGLNTDGSGSFRPGKAWREVSSTPSSAAQRANAVQLGLTPGCHITAVGWNKMGTERSTGKILLGSSFGEIYEYEIEAGEDDHVGVSLNKKEELLPSLMVRLNESESGTGTGTGSGGVSGLYFSTGEDENSGIVVLAATSGVNKQTRLHSYLSMGKSHDSDGNAVDLRNVFACSDNLSSRSFMELPGAINFADLIVCDDTFAMRTETGIYYGTIDHSNSRNVPWNKRGNGILDAGMFSYETSSIPISIAITSHHFIMLYETNELRFINRVAKKTIQKEYVDWVALTHSTGISASPIDDGIYSGHSELIMDVRRPDQVWLRKSRSLMHISSTREDRDVWKYSLEACLKGATPHGVYSTPHASLRRLNDDKHMDAEFEHAKLLCTNSAQKAVVTAARAEFHMSHGRVDLGSKYLAQCPSSLVPFTETAVRLALPSLGVEDKRHKRESKLAYDALKSSNLGLIAYLSDKMRAAKSRNDSVACTMIGAWLVELYLHEREHGKGLILQADDGEQKIQTINGSHSAMQQFLSSNAYNMDAKTILRILCSHDVAASECSLYATSAGDIGTAVNAALCNSDYMVSIIAYKY